MILDEGFPISSFGEFGFEVKDNWQIWRGKVATLMVIMNTFPRHGWQNPKEIPNYSKAALLSFEHEPSLIWDCECDTVVGNPSYNYNRVCDRRKAILAVIIFLYK